MDDTCSLPLIGQAWLLCGFDFDFDPGAEEPDLYAIPGETPLLLVPLGCAGRELERAFGWGIAQLYLQRYGVVNLVRGIRAWEAIVGDLGGAREEAAD
jgi:hypothetical protein